MGKVHDIVVENFKSYQGRVQVGPFRHFTCIIGPNGAGKSNLMDAISFVLGVQAKQLRSEKLRDLIYRKEGENPKENRRSASVELTYMGSDDGHTLPAGEGAEALVFKRLILPGGEGRFQVNGVTLPYAEYMAKLEGINILSKVRNFLVFQGDVEVIAQRQGRDLTAFFEQISGSEAYRQEYEQLAAEKAKKEDNARYLFTKKRNAINEKKRVGQQKQEADEYRTMELSRRNLQLEFCLFRLHGFKRQLDDVTGSKQGTLAEKAAANTALEENRRAVEATDRERAQTHLATSQAERAAAAARTKLDRLLPEHVASKSRLNFLQHRIEDLQQHREKDEHKQETMKEHIKKLAEEQARLETELRSVTEHVAKRRVRFTPQQQLDFEHAKRETQKLSAAGMERVRELEHQIRGITAERARAERDQREMAARFSQLQLQAAQLKEATDTARQTGQSESTRAQQRARELERLKARVGDFTDEKEQLQSERQQLVESIQDATATERQLQREREQSQACSNLMAAVPGVYGRVVDLCRPAQKRLHVAVNVAIGKFVDAVIVDTTQTARACVQHLKERMLRPMTFLPLSDLRCPAPDPRLQELVSSQPRLRLALNCLHFDERLSRAFEFLLGDVVIADTMSDGRGMAFGDARRLGLNCKVVTLAGEAIAKNGNMSVNSEATREGATHFDFAEVEASKARLGEVDRRIYEIHSLESAGGVDMVMLKDEVRLAETRSADAAAHLQRLEAQLTQKLEELGTAQAASEALGPECARLAKQEEKLLKEQRAIEDRITKEAAGLFAKLNEELGVADIRKAVREWQREEEVGRRREDELARQLSSATAERSMYEQTLVERSSTNAQETVAKLRAELQLVGKQEEEHGKGVEVLRAELAGHDARAKTCAEAERGKDRQLLQLRQVGKEQRQQLLQLEKRLRDLSATEQSMHDARANLLRQSILEDVEVPLLRGALLPLPDLADAAAGSEPAARRTATAPAADREEIVVDFSALPPEKQDASGGPAAKMLEEEYRAELERLRLELVRLSPNLKAGEQWQDAADHLQTASRDADAARREIQDIDTRFEAARKARRERFMDCFKKVAGEISEIYRRLTANTAGLQSDGGSAYLDLEDAEEPYNGGIKYTAMPPAKRFRDMHLLSGGEKTLAAVALLFAVHAYQKPPFMVLDEVDAALDANNVAALASYIEQTDCQTIVISLKDKFFTHSAALVGVWKNKPEETSAVLTLDLSRYLTPTTQHA